MSVFGWHKRRKRGRMLRAAGGFIAPAYGPTGATGPAIPTFMAGYTPSSAISTTLLSGAGTPIARIEEPTPPVLQDLGTAIEPIVALRSFYVDTDFDKPLLLSLNGTAWPYRAPLYAVCGNDVFGDHEVPYEHCNCGIYAWNKTLTAHVTGKLYGEVYLWGDVLICDNGGYRAETAYPKSLIIEASPTRAVMRVRDGLEDAYGVPVKIRHPEALDEDLKKLVGKNAFTTWSEHFNTALGS